MNQDKIMKRRMITAIVLLIITLIALVIFIALFVDESRRVQETYRRQFTTELRHVNEEISIYQKAEGDLDYHYTRITVYMANAGSYAFLIDNFTDKQIVINEISTCLIKYPQQMKGKLDDLQTAVSDILSDLDKGYEEAKTIYESLDLKGK
ncbi:hypothetical protein SAMN02910317_01549 [Ruminococcaceae bacterium FB2012]|nr:hypothetical protein SAMN02910317_01549 [Ruminococcaceae bacterium FB2012]